MGAFRFSMLSDPFTRFDRIALGIAAGAVVLVAAVALVVFLVLRHMKRGDEVTPPERPR